MNHERFFQILGLLRLRDLFQGRGQPNEANLSTRSSAANVEPSRPPSTTLSPTGPRTNSPSHCLQRQLLAAKQTGEKEVIGRRIENTLDDVVEL